MSKVEKDIMNEFVKKVILEGKHIEDEDGQLHHVVDVKRVAELWSETYDLLEKVGKNVKKARQKS